MRKSKQAGKKKHITIRNTWPYHLLLLPGVIILLIYTVIPFFGNVIAFMDYKPILGIKKSKWVGLDNFTFMFKLPDTFKIFRNTLVIAIGKLTFNLLMSVFFAILLNEVTKRFFKKVVQTIVFLPHFLSWVVLAMVFRDLLDGIWEAQQKTPVSAMPGNSEAKTIDFIQGCFDRWAEEEKAGKK